MATVESGPTRSVTSDAGPNPVTAGTVSEAAVILLGEPYTQGQPARSGLCNSEATMRRQNVPLFVDLSPTPSRAIIERGRQVARQWMILRLLGRRRMSIDELSRELAVCTRTIRRDLDVLQAVHFPLVQEDANQEDPTGSREVVWRVMNWQGGVR